MPVPDAPHNEMTKLCYAIGTLVISWAPLESTLEFWVMAARNAGGKKLEPEIPRMAHRKISFLTKCAQKLPKLQSEAPEMLRILKAAKSITSIRRYAAHGVPLSYDHEAKSFRFTTIAVDQKTGHSVDAASYTIEEIRDAARLSIALGEAAKLVSDSLVTKFLGYKIDKATGKYTV